MSRSDGVSAPPNYRLLTGNEESTVLMHVPHASRAIPAWVRDRIVLDDAQLDSELSLMTDAQTELIAREAAALCSVRPWIFENQMSRLVVDPERFPDPEQEPMADPAIGMGAVYTKTAHLDTLRGADAAHERELLDMYFAPYASALTEAVRKVLEHHERVTIIDIHSYPAQELPYERLHHADAKRPAICLGFDSFHTPEWLRQAAQDSFCEFGDVAVNEPFAGTYVPLEFYESNPHVTSIMVEIRRDLYVERPAARATISEAVASLVDSIELFQDGVSDP